MIRSLEEHLQDWAAGVSSLVVRLRGMTQQQSPLPPLHLGRQNWAAGP